MFATCNSKGEYANIYNAEELSQIVADTVEYYQNETNRYMIQNKKLTEDAVKVVEKQYEDKINNLKERLSMSYGEFHSKKERSAYSDFVERHMHDRATSKANGGRVPYIIPIYTGIGCIKTVVCQICGESEDITDMEVW